MLTRIAYSLLVIAAIAVAAPSWASPKTLPAVEAPPEHEVVDESKDPLRAFTLEELLLGWSHTKAYKAARVAEKRTFQATVTQIRSLQEQSVHLLDGVERNALEDLVQSTLARSKALTARISELETQEDSYAFEIRRRFRLKGVEHMPF